MKRTLARMVTIGASIGLSTAVLAMVGCSSNTQPAAQAQSQPAAAWKLTLQTKCADNSADSCVAGHGFTVSADGKYQVGPTANGKVINGMLSADELKAMNARVAALSAPPARSSADSTGEEPGDSSSATDQNACEPIALDSASDVTITMTAQGSQRVLAMTKDSQVCFQSANTQAVSALHDEMIQLAQKYYTTPFPDPCADSVASLESLYNNVRTCSADADCAYVSDDYQAVPSSSDEFITTDAGTIAKPLVVANTSLLGSQQKALVDATAAAAKACGAGTDMDRYYTGSQIDGFLASVGAPTCQQHVCHAATPASAAPAAPAAPNAAPAPAGR